MSKFGKNLAAAFATILLLSLLSACDSHEGPAERAGRDIDKALDNAGKHIERAGERIQDEARSERK